ncbi:MAG: 3-phosphoglycerate dehydrogenase [Porphyromonadaceae bacterium]|nr:3-phosphoglycerate dehydrogenase [Porphyromonadaceae bacterium]
MKVLVATDKPFAKVAIDGIRQELDGVDYELVLLERYTEKQQLLDAVANVDALIVRSDIVDEEVIKAGKNLKIVVRAGAGYDNIDLKAATEAGICVMNTPGQNANAVAELVFGMLIYGVRNFYNGTPGTELRGKKLGIHAYGNIGKNVARIAKGFQMPILAYDIYSRAEIINSDGIDPTISVKTLYRHSDIVTVHVPLTDKTRGLIGKILLSNMKSDAVLVNTARKEVINEQDLLDFMIAHPKFKYLTDIKPDMHDQFVEKVGSQYFTTPKKMGAQTSEANVNAGIAAAHQIVDYLRNGNHRYRVND